MYNPMAANPIGIILLLFSTFLTLPAPTPTSNNPAKYPHNGFVMRLYHKRATEEDPMRDILDFLRMKAKRPPMRRMYGRDWSTYSEIGADVKSGAVIFGARQRAKKNHRYHHCVIVTSSFFSLQFSSSSMHYSRKIRKYKSLLPLFLMRRHNLKTMHICDARRMPRANVAGYQSESLPYQHVFERESKKKKKRRDAANKVLGASAFVENGGIFEHLNSSSLMKGAALKDQRHSATPASKFKQQSTESTTHSKFTPLRLFPNILYVVQNHPFMDYFTLSGSAKLLRIHVYKFLLLKDDHTLSHICRNNHLKQLFPNEVLSKPSEDWLAHMAKRKRIRLHYQFICHHINSASTPVNYAGGYYLREYAKADRDVSILTCNNTRSLKLFCLQHGFGPVNKNIFILSRRDLIRMGENELLDIYQRKWRSFPSVSGHIFEQLVSQLILNEASFQSIIMQSYANEGEHTPDWIHDYKLSFHEKILDDLENPGSRHGKHSLSLLLNGDTGRLVFCMDRHRVDILGLLEVKENTESFNRFGPHKIPLVVQITHQQAKLLQKLCTDWESTCVYHFTRNAGLSHAISNFYVLHDRQTNKKKYRVVRVIAAHHLDAMEKHKFLTRIEQRRKTLHKKSMVSNVDLGGEPIDPDNTYLSIWSMDTNPMYHKYWRLLSERQL